MVSQVLKPIVNDISALAPAYPAAAALRLMEVLMPHAKTAQPSSLSRGKRRYNFIISGVSQLYLVTSGIHYIRRRSNNKIIGTFISPVLLGWSGKDRPPKGYPHCLDSLYLERRDSGTMLALPLSEAYCLAQEANLMMDVISLMSFHINHLLIMGDQVLDLRAQEIVLNMLRRLMLFPPEMRKQFTVVKFIEERCMLARSTILRELSHLRRQGILDMYNGYLVTLIEKER